MANILASFKIKNPNDVVIDDGIDTFPANKTAADLHSSDMYPHTVIVDNGATYLVRGVPEGVTITAHLVDQQSDPYTVDAVPHVVEIPGKTADLFGGHPTTRPPRP